MLVKYNITYHIKLVTGIIYSFFLFLPFGKETNLLFSNMTPYYGRILLLTSLLWAGILILKFIQKKRDIIIYLSDLLFILYIIYLVFISIYHSTPFNPEIVLLWVNIGMLYLISKFISKSEFRIYLWTIPIAICLQLSYNLIHSNNYPLLGTLHNITGIFRNTGLWSCFVMYSVIFLIALLLFFKKYKSLTLSLLTLYLILLYSGNSRAAWLDCFIGVIYLIKEQFKFHLELIFPKYKVIIFLIIAGMMISSLSLLYLYKKESANGRLLIWATSLQMIKENPTTGHGIDSFKQKYMNYQESYLNHQKHFNTQLADNPYYPFNEYIRITVEQGMIGLLLCILWLGSPFWFEKHKPHLPTEKKDDQRSKLLKSLLISFALFALFSYPSESLLLTVIPVTCTGVLSKDSIPVIRFRKGYLPISSCILYAIIGIYVFWYTPYKKAIYQWNTAIQKSSQTPASSLNTLENLLPKLENTPVFLLNYGLLLNQQQQYSKAQLILRYSAQIYSNYGVYIELGKSCAALGEDTQAIRYWQKASAMVPHKFTPLYLKMKLFQKNGQNTKAIRIARTILNKEIKVATPDLNKILREAQYLNNNYLPNF